jgi:hypothetical protein
MSDGLVCQTMRSSGPTFRIAPKRSPHALPEGVSPPALEPGSTRPPSL